MDSGTLENGSNSEGKQADGEIFKDAFSGSLDSQEMSGTIYQGPVYHIGVNRVGRHFCHLRFLRISGIYVEMFKKEPQSDTKPIRRGIAGRFLKVEDLGRRVVEDNDLYVLKLSNSLDNTTQGEIACQTALEVHNWKEAFLHAKDEADTLYQKGNRLKLKDQTAKLNLDGHRPRLRRYAKGLTKLTTIGRGSDYLLKKEARGSPKDGGQVYANTQDNDIFDQHDWRCVRTVNGIRILEDASSDVTEKMVILKSVGVIEASPSAVFEMLMNITHPHRREWDLLTGDMKLVEQVNGHSDIVYGTFDPKYLRRWNPKSDFVFSRVWRHDPDDTYSILQSSESHKDCPKKSGFHRITLNPTIWEIKPLQSSMANGSKSLVTQIMEIRSTGWGRWKHKYFAKLDRTVPYVILCQVAGLRDYFAAHTVPDTNVAPDWESRNTSLSASVVETCDSADGRDGEFYDAIAAEMTEEEETDDESDDEVVSPGRKGASNRFKNTALALMRMTPHARAEEQELGSCSDKVDINLTSFKGSLPQSESMKDSSCWTDPGGEDFMVRGKTYPSDCIKVSGGEPLLKLLAVDWLQSESRIDFVARHSKYLVQSEAGKKLPFILVINLQVPAKPNYSMIFYFGAERPISKGSLLDSFVDGSDTYRDSRFKLIPRIVKGYWFVKKAVGTKACLLGQAVNCRYLRQDNFLEIDVDIGSSSVARSIIGLVLKHVTSLVVDMAVLIEGREESELPEYLLGSTRVIQVELDSAVSHH